MENNSLYPLAYQAFSGTSFYPERRAKDTVEWIEAQLAEDLETIGSESGSTGNYKEKYLAHAHKWLNAKSRVMSTMITGPANFPVARNQKHMRWEDSAYTNWMDWREKYIKAVFRTPTPSPEEELDNALKDYDKAVANQELMKAANRIIRKKLIDVDKLQELVDLGLLENKVRELLVADCCGDTGFPRYTLTNNNAKIKRLKSKVLTMKARIAAKQKFQPIVFPVGRIDIESDRVVIYHDEKPEKEVRDKLKSRGFRWSGQYGCWCRKHTARALMDAREIVGA